jgi:integrase
VKLLKSILSWSDVGTRDWKLRLPEIHEEEQRWFTEEVEKIIEVAEGQYKVLFHLAYTTGLRGGELLGLRVDDFNFDAGRVRVTRSTFCNIEDTPKTQKGRSTIYLDRRTQEDLRVLLAGTCGRIFMTRLGTPLNVGDVDRYLPKPIYNRPRIRKGTMRAFRHRRVSRTQDAGVNEKVKSSLSDCPKLSQLVARDSAMYSCLSS